MRRYSPCELGILLSLPMNVYASETPRLGSVESSAALSTCAVAVAVLPLSSSKYGHS
jgi:hypothetical protein